MRIGNKKNDWVKVLLGCVLAVAFFSGTSPKAKADGAAPTTTTSTTTTTSGTICPKPSAYDDWSMDDNVHGRVGIPLWAFGMDGDINIRGHEGHINKDFWSFFDHLDYIAPIKVEIRQGRFYFNAEAIYVKQRRDIEPRGIFASPSANGDLNLRELFSGLNLGYEIVRCPQYTLTAFAGGRMTYIKANLDFNGPLGSATASKSRFIGDPVVGLYGTWDFSQHFGIYVKGDVGGFGLIGDHFTWQVEPGAEYRISPHTYARLEWRCLSIDFAKNDFNLDTTFMGPQAEIGWRF